MMGVENFVVVFVALTSVVKVKTENIQALGCWKDNNVKRALPLLENNHPLLLDSYKKRTNPIIKCAQVANQKGFQVFALQNGGQCFGGPKGEKTFESYGPSNLCKGGTGGRWSNNVYSTRKFYRRTVHQQADPSPWDPYCSRDLDMVILLDGSGTRSSKSNKRRWNDMLEFTQRFAKGFDTHARIGVVEYSNDVKIPIDMLKAAPPEKFVDLVKNIELPGGRRSLNDALKTAWRDQLKENNRTSADKVIVALTTGNVPYGLYGSSQFLSDHLVRVVAVGVDRDVNYEFLQSVASYRDVKNIFSVNHEQLGDIAPFVYRDICNSFPDYVSEQTTTSAPTTTSPPTTPVPQNNAQHPPSSANNSTTNQNNATASNNAPQNAPVNNTKAAGRDDIISIPLSALSGLPLQLLGQKKNTLPTPLDGNGEKRADVVTVLDPKNPREHLASMVLINPKPELNLDLTKAEVSEINNRRHHQEDSPTDSLSDALEKYKKLVKDGYADHDEVKNGTSLRHQEDKDGEKEFTTSQDEFYGANEREENQHALPHKEKPKEHEIEFKTSKDEKFPHQEGESKEHSKEEGVGMKYEAKGEANKVVEKEEKQVDQEKVDKEDEEKKEKNKKGKKEKNYKVETSKFKPKFIPQTKSESPKPFPTEGHPQQQGEAVDDLKTVSDEKSSSKPGELEQTVEYHSGDDHNNHVSVHPHHKIDYQNMFQGKLKDKAKNEFFNERISHQNEHDSSSTKHNVWDSSTLSPLKKEGFLTEDLGLTPIRDQYESAAIFGNEDSTISSKADIPQNGKIMGLLGEIEQAAQQTAQMAQHELKKLDEGDQTDLPVTSKRVLESKSKKIDRLLSSLNGEENQQLLDGNPKLGLEAVQLQDVMQTLQNMFKTSVDTEQESTSERREIDEKHKKKSLLDFHPIKIAKSQIASSNAQRSTPNASSNNVKRQKYQSYLRSFEKHLKEITSSRRTKGHLQQKHDINHLYHVKASDNVTSFPFNLPFATNHGPSPIIPNPKMGPTHPFKDVSVAHYSPWLHPANNFPLNHGPTDLQFSDLQVQNILLQPNPIIGPSRSNTNQKPSITATTTLPEGLSHLQPRQKVQPNAKQTSNGATFQQREKVPQMSEEPDYSDIGGEVPHDEFNDAFPQFNINVNPHGFAASNQIDPSIAKQQGFGNFPPINDVSDLPPSSMIQQQPASGIVAPKNPVLMVSSSGNVAPSHDEVIDKNVHAPKTEGGKFDHLNLNTLTRKMHTPVIIATPKPPSLPEMTPMHQFSSMTPFGGVKPLHARMDMKRRPLMKDRKSKDATRLMKHINKKTEIKTHPTSKRQTSPKHPPPTKHQHTTVLNKKTSKAKKKTKKAYRARTRSTSTTTKPSSKNNKNSMKTKTLNSTSLNMLKNNQTAKLNTTIKSDNSTKQQPESPQQTKNTTTKQHSNTTSSTKKSIDYNKPLSIYSQGRSIHFKTSPEVSEVLMNGIVQKKGVIDLHKNDETKKENDFPMIFNVVDFNLNDLPMLTKGRSYVLTSNEKGRVTVSVNNNENKKTLPKKLVNTASTKTPDHQSKLVNTTSTKTPDHQSKLVNTTSTNTRTTDHLSELEVENNKLVQSLAGLKMLKNSSSSTTNFEEPLSNTEDQVMVTHDFTDIKNTKDRTKTVTEMMKNNPTLTFGSIKHGSIPVSNTTLKNENSSNKTTSTNQSNIASSLANQKNITLLANQKNITSFLANQKNLTSPSANQTRGQSNDKLMAYIKGMSKFEDDDDNDLEIINNESNKKDVSSTPHSPSATSPKNSNSAHNNTKTDRSNSTKTNHTESESRETTDESRQRDQEDLSTLKHHGFVSLLKASQNVKKHQNEVETIATQNEQRNKTAETEDELRQKINIEQSKPIHQKQHTLNNNDDEMLSKNEENLLQNNTVHDEHQEENHVQHEVRTTNKTTSLSTTSNTSKGEDPVNTKQQLVNKDKKNNTMTDLSKFKETSSDVLTFQMQNTTYKVFDSYPSAATQTKSRTEPSKVEKASYETATGAVSKPAPVKQPRPAMKTPTKAEKQAYNASLNKHQTLKRKLLMNVSLAEAMEKMNPTPKSSNIESNTTSSSSSSVVAEGRNVLQKHLNADPGSILGCSKPLRLLYVIDVSEGMGRGTSRVRRWSRLKDFIQNINVNLLKGVEHEYMVYNIEPRIMDGLEKCDRTTELFTIADECLCNKKYDITSDGNGCSVNQPALRENMDDWGKVGPRAGKALQRAKEIYFSKDKDKYKNVILLLSHKQSVDDIERTERDLKASGISLIDIELGQRHDLKRKSVIPHPPEYPNQRRRSKRSVVVPTHSGRVFTVVSNYGKTLLRKQPTTNSKRRNTITTRKRSFIPVNKVEIRKRNKPELKTKRGSMKRNNHKKEDTEFLRKQINSSEPLIRRNNILMSPTIKQQQQTTSNKSIDSMTGDTHKVKVSLKKLTQTLKDIIGKVCTSNTEEELNMKKRSAILSGNFY